jgi:hypothetical protein
MSALATARSVLVEKKDDELRKKLPGNDSDDCYRAGRRMTAAARGWWQVRRMALWSFKAFILADRSKWQRLAKEANIVAK